MEARSTPALPTLLLPTKKQCANLFDMTAFSWKSPEPTAVGAVSSAVAVHVASRRWLSFFVRPLCMRQLFTGQLDAAAGGYHHCDFRVVWHCVFVRWSRRICCESVVARCLPTFSGQLLCHVFILLYVAAIFVCVRAASIRLLFCSAHFLDSAHVLAGISIMLASTDDAVPNTALEPTPTAP